MILRSKIPSPARRRALHWLYVPPAPPGGTGNMSTTVYDANADGKVDVPAQETMTYTQPTPAKIWTINHNLGRRPVGLVVLNNLGNRVYAGENYVDNNTLIITFAKPFSGQAIYQ